MKTVERRSRDDEELREEEVSQKGRRRPSGSELTADDVARNERPEMESKGWEPA